MKKLFIAALLSGAALASIGSANAGQCADTSGVNQLPAKACAEYLRESARQERLVFQDVSPAFIQFQVKQNTAPGWRETDGN